MELGEGVSVLRKGWFEGGCGLRGMSATGNERCQDKTQEAMIVALGISKAL